MNISVLALSLCAAAATAARPGLPRLKVSENRRFLVQHDGRPFVWIGDTAWELFHRLDRAQAALYLDTRARQGFTIVQAVALAELDGLTDPSAHGDLPLVDRDPTRPAVTPGADPASAAQYDYWDHVDHVVDAANARGLYVAVLPTWGRWVHDDKDRVFDARNAEVYGRFIGARLRGKGVVWVLGGDRTIDGAEEVWRAMARGLATGAGPEALMTLHPRGGETSARWFHDDDWLDFNMWQTGHSRAERTRSWRRIAADYARTPVKPVLDGEPIYEDIPIEFNGKEFGYAFDAHVRQRAYWAVFAGAFGHTYGHNSVWQMWAPPRKPVIAPLMTWQEALDRPGARQMRHLRALLESRPFLSRVPDQALVTDELEGADRVQATRGDGYALIYSAQGRRFTVRLDRVGAGRLRAWWFNPRTGTAAELAPIAGTGEREFVPPGEGFGADWVLVLDDAARRLRPPGAPGPLVP